LDVKEIAKLFNQAIATENACRIRYLTHAAVLQGPYADTVGARLTEIANDEASHAEELRKRVADSLNEYPTMEVDPSDLIRAESLEEILDVNIREEQKAIGFYLKVFAKIPREEVLLHETIEEIIEDEQEHLEELTTLRAVPYPRKR